MNGKIKIPPSVLAQLRDAAPDALVTLTLRTWTPLTTEEIIVLTSLGGRLYYDNGMMAILTVPAQHVGKIAEWECVLEVCWADIAGPLGKPDDEATKRDADAK